MRQKRFSGVESLSPGLRIAICTGLIAVSGMLVQGEIRLQISGEHVVGRVTHIEHVSRGAHGGTNVYTSMSFVTADGTPTTCTIGDVHAEVGRMIPLRYLPPSSCARAGDLRTIGVFGSFGLIGLVGLAWTLARRPKSQPT